MFACERISLPSSAFVPTRRTTMGISVLTSFKAARIPRATSSPRVIPPNMLNKTALTFASESMIRRAAETFSEPAPPPMSRKLAGSPPFNLIISMVAIARPAPFTIQPMNPSNLMNDRLYLRASVSDSGSISKSRISARSRCRNMALSSKTIFPSTASSWS